ncbi:MAG: PASTA domain-containing protein [Candidatus Latescibacteria bacterium]|nr:PASTA domain-containing protein [Candidatus Latescibacterota bacterium]
MVMEYGTSYLARVRLVAHIGVLIWLVIVGRLWYIQVWADEEYSAQAKKQQERRVELKARRGRILDRHGESMAINLRSLSFAADPNKVPRPERVVRTFSQVSGTSRADLRERLQRPRSFVWLARQVDFDRGEKITQMGMGKAQGVYRFVEFKRCYPLGASAGQLLGYTNVDNAGIEGSELAFEKHLGGRSGLALLKIDAKGHLLSDVERIEKEQEDGVDVVLTINAVYQGIAEDELAKGVERYHADSGIAIVMEPSTGEILAMANIPLYDPNTSRRYSASVKRNRAITDLFEPGSTFKIVTLAAALEEKSQKPDERIFCEHGKMAIVGGFIRDAHPHGWLTFREVIEQSSNIGMIKVARTIEAKLLYEYATMFGFGNTTGIDLPGEINGVLTDPSHWSLRSRDTIVIGQEVGATALQLANAYCAIANGGKLMVPRILKAIVAPDGETVAETDPEVIRRAIGRKTAKMMREFLCGVVERGTGVKAQIPGVKIAGKTGTAQKVNEGGHGYAPGRYVSSFVGFLPADDPKLLCLVVVDSPREVYWGSEVAAPIFRKIMERILSAEGDRVVRRSVDDSREVEEDDGRVVVPNLKGMLRTAAEAALEETGLNVEVAGKDDMVTWQSVEPGLRVDVGATIRLSCEERPRDVEMPRLVGMPIKQAINRLSEGGVRFRVIGSGVVTQQSPRPGAKIGKGIVCVLKGDKL